MKKIIATILILLIAVLSYTVYAKPKIKDAGIPLGTQLPEITAVNIAGKIQTIKQLSGEKGLVLVFFRSADWCPFCKRHLIEINDWNSKINDLGFKVAAISYDSTEILKKFSDKRKLKYPLLADQNHKTMESLNVLNDEEEPGDEHFGIPFPGVMIINSEGKLVYKYFYKGYIKRVKMKQLYKKLKTLN